MKNRKGFTLVELLAVVVILGIIIMMSIPVVGRWIDRSKMESDEGNKKALIMAAQSYAQGNTKKLPKSVGGTTKITAQELLNANFLKEELVNSEKKNCMDSYVKIVKQGQNNYKYTAFINCGEETVANEDSVTKPIISIGFIGDKNEDEIIETVKVTAFKAVIEGGDTATTRYTLASYSYSISVRYSSSDQIVEIYNSGNIEANQQERIVIEKNLADYTDITKVNDFIVTVEAYNSIGGYKKQTMDSSYKDNTPPKCGKVTGEPEENEWNSVAGSIRTISVLCSDGEGSGCVKDEYTKSFDTEMEYGYITISDNAGNTTDCKVRVNNDWTEPKLTVTAFVRISDSKNGKQVATITADKDNPTVTMSSYTDNVNDWLNNAKFPKGLNFEIKVDDNVKVASGQWSNNRGLIFDPNDGNLETLTKGAFKLFTEEDNTTSDKLEEQGIRRARYVLEDAAGNKVTVKIKAKLDRNSPSLKWHKDHLDTEDGVYVVINCTDGESGCSGPNPRTDKNVKSSRYTFTVQDIAGNPSSGEQAVLSYACHPYQYACGSYVCGTKECNCGWVCTIVDDNPHSGNAYCQVQKWKCSTCKKYCTSYCTGYNTCYK